MIGRAGARAIVRDADLGVPAPGQAGPVSALPREPGGRGKRYCSQSPRYP